MYFESTLADDPTPLRRKVLETVDGGRRKVLTDMRPQPFRDLAADDLLDTSDLCRIYDCSLRTIYRWMSDRGLWPAGKVGKEFLFTKGGLVEWHASQSPPPLTAHAKLGNL